MTDPTRPLLIDGHNDLPWALREHPDIDVADVARPVPRLHTDLPRLRTGGVGAQFWSVFVPCSYTGADAVTAVLEQVDLVHRMIAAHPADLAFADTAADVEAAVASGRVASLLGAEGGHAIDSSLAVLRVLRRLGVRYLTLTHNENTPWADSATDTPAHGGLTAFGREVVAEMNRIGMIVDLSHVAATTMHDALDTTTAPVLFTHSSCRAVTGHPRNIGDDVLARLAGNGGVAMVTFVPQFVSDAVWAWEQEGRGAVVAAGEDVHDVAAWNRLLDDGRVPPAPEATLDDVVAHVEHAREVAGIDHIGIGGDYDGTPHLPRGLADVTGYPRLLDALRARSWSEDDVAKLAGRNALRVLREVDAAVV